METIEKLPHPLSQTEMTDRAYGRVDALLRAYGFSHSVVRSQYCLDILDEAMRQIPTDEDQLESASAGIALGRIKTGIDRTIVAVGLTVESVNREDFNLALQATQVPRKHPNILLGDQHPEAELIGQILRGYESQAQPTLHRISMGASTLRFDAIGEVTTTTERFFASHPILKTGLGIALITATLYLVYNFAK